MLSVKTITPKQGEKYYTKENYYSKEEGQKNSEWSGRGAATFGLKGHIKGEDFTNLLNGRSPDGTETLSGKAIDSDKRRAGTDLTFSAPKSVSVAALVHGDERLEVAHRQAVNRALEVVEERYAQTRITTEEGRVAVRTGNLIAAQFHHDTSRALDPQLHTHCVVLNATQLEDGRWQSFSNEELYRNKMLLGLVYRNELAHECQRLGCEVEVKPDRGEFEIKGYSEEQLRGFSKRSEQIKDYVGEHASAEAKAWAALKTRATKGKEIPRTELKAYWQQEAESLDLERPRMWLSINHNDAKTAVDASIDHCSERTVGFSREQMERFALEHHLGQQDWQNLESRINTNPDLLQAPDGRFTTQEALNRERRTIAMVWNGQQSQPAIASVQRTEHYLEKTNLDHWQRDAVLRTATTNDQFMAWQGVAGAGKSHALNEFRQLAERQGYQVQGFAPAAEQAKVLSESAKIDNCRTVDSLIASKRPRQVTPNQIWIVDEAGMLSAKDAHDLLQRARSDRARVILVGDTRQLGAVEAGNPFKSLQEQGIQTVYLNQSRRQKNEQIKAGVDLLAEGKIEPGVKTLSPFISKVASREERVKRMTEDYLALKPEERAKALLLAATNDERLEITDQIRTRLKQEGSLGQSNLATQLKQKDLTEVQARYCHNYKPGEVVIPTATYKRQGLEKHQRYEVTEVHKNTLTLKNAEGKAVRVNPANFNKSVFEQQQLEIAVGDQLKWRRNDHAMGRRNGQEFTVKALVDGRAEIEYGNGKTEQINLAQPQHLDHALVSTTYSAQGKSADRVYGALDRNLGKESFYVNVSRAKHDLRLYASEDLSEITKRAARSQTKENVRDVLAEIAKKAETVKETVKEPAQETTKQNWEITR